MTMNMNCRFLTAFVLVPCAVLLTSCGGSVRTDDFPEIYYRPEYASGFEIVGMKDSMSRVIRVTAPWQGADSTARELFISRGGETPPPGFRGQVLESGAERIAAMSSSHVAMLDLVGECRRIVAVSGIDFITNGYVRRNRDRIADVGSDADADFEKLMSVSPDIVLLYGISASSRMEARLESLGIPYFYVGEYIEPSPLGRAEWVVAVAEIAGKADRGKAVFHEIEKKYNELKNSVCHDAEKPSVMLNVPYGDVWFMASGASAMARMIEDAGGEYVYKDNYTNKSLPVDLETAYLLASRADCWLNVGKIRTLDELKTAYPSFAEVPSVLAGNVYNCDKRANAYGGNDFWETGQLRPDLVLSDLISVFSGGETDTLYYYRRLK